MGRSTGLPASTDLLVRKRLMRKFQVIVGDWSADGHEKTKKFFVTSSMSKKQAESEYKRLCKLFKINPSNVCDEYEDCEVSLEDLDKMHIGHVIKVWQNNTWYDEPEENENHRLSPLEFAQLWATFMAQHTGKTFEVHEEKPSEAALPIGGYGCFN
jgi:hypothetical protein